MLAAKKTLAFLPWLMSLSGSIVLARPLVPQPAEDNRAQASLPLAASSRAFPAATAATAKAAATADGALKHSAGAAPSPISPRAGHDTGPGVAAASAPARFSQTHWIVPSPATAGARRAQAARKRTHIQLIVEAPRQVRRRKWSGTSHGPISRPQVPDDYFRGTPSPGKGEIALAGHVLSVAGDQSGCEIRVLAYRLANGRSARLTGWRTKKVSWQGKLRPKMRPGDEWILVGPDSGAGSPLQARAVY